MDLSQEYLPACGHRTARKLLFTSASRAHRSLFVTGSRWPYSLRLSASRPQPERVGRLGFRTQWNPSRLMRKQKLIEDIYPLSPTQQGVLFHTLYAPYSGVYLEQLSCTLAGELDVSALKSAWSEVIKQQTVLRTGFVWRNRPKPLQVVYCQAILPWEEHDWRSLSAAQQEQSLDEFLQLDRETGFDLSKPPL